MSPIKDLTGRGADFPEIGKIRKGAKKPEKGNRPGADLDYFRADFYKGEEATAEVYHRIYGDEPQELKVLLPFNRIEDIWDAWVEGYTAGGLIYRSNGNGPDQTALGEIGVVFWRDPLSGQTLVRNGRALRDIELPEGLVAKQGDPVPCIARMGFPVGRYEGVDGSMRELRADPNGRLKLIVQGLARFAYLRFVTTSQYDIGNIDAQLEGIAQIQREANLPGIKGVPLLLRRREREVSVPMKDGDRIVRRRMAKWLVSIEPDPEWAQMKAIAMMQEAAPQILEGHFVELLPAPQDEAEDRPEAADAAESAEVPAEPAVVRTPPRPRPTQAAPVTGERQFTVATLDAITNEGLSLSREEAAKMLGHSPWVEPGKAMDRKKVLAWCRAFVRARAEDLNETEAGQAATAELAELGG